MGTTVAISSLAAGSQLLFHHKGLQSTAYNGAAGEIYGGLDVAEGRNDGQALLEALSVPGADVTAVLSALRGPWAILYWQAASQTVWLGRDPIGEASLNLRVCEHTSFV